MPEVYSSMADAKEALRRSQAAIDSAGKTLREISFITQKIHAIRKETRQMQNEYEWRYLSSQKKPWDNALWRMLYKWRQSFPSLVGPLSMGWALVATVHLCVEDKSFSNGIFFKYIFPFIVGFFLSQFAILVANRQSKVVDANRERDVYRDKLLEIKKLSRECATSDYRSNGRKCPVLRQVANLVAEVK